MPDIERSLNEASRSHILTDKAKEIMLESPYTSKKQRKRFDWKIAFASIGIVAVVLAIILAFSKTNNTTSSSLIAPRNADDAFIERVEDFIAIVKDGTITDVDRRNYLAKSDWALQLAFETRNSIFYNKPNVSNKQVQQLNTLLVKMHAYIRAEQTVHQEIKDLQFNSSFEDFIMNVGKWNELLSSYTDVTYSTSTKEKPQFNNKFLADPWVAEVILVFLFVVFVYLFIRNIRNDKKIHFFIFHIIVLVFIGQYFFEKDPNQYGYDETSILQSMQVNVTETFRNVQVLELLAIAQFDDIRYGLAKLDDDSIMITEFVKQRSGYVMRNSSIAYSHTVNRNYYIGPRELADVWGVRPESEIQQIVYTVEESNKEIELPINSNFADIYMILKPNEGYGVNVEFQYEEGYEMR